MKSFKKAIPKLFLCCVQLGWLVNAYAADVEGSLTSVGTLEAAQTPESPSAIAFDPKGRFVFVANWNHRSDQNSIYVYTINPEKKGELTPVQRLNVAGSYDATSVTVDPVGSFVYLASDYKNFGFKIADPAGELSLITGVDDQIRMIKQASITVDPTGEFVYVTNAPWPGNLSDLPYNALVYKINRLDGTLTPPRKISLGGKGAIRGISFDPNTRNPFVYVVNEGNKHIYTYRIDIKRNETMPDMTLVQEVDPSSTMRFPTRLKPLLFIQANPNGESIVVLDENNIHNLKIDPKNKIYTGTLDYVALEGPPKSITIDPTGKFAYAMTMTSDMSNRVLITSYALSEETGKITKLDVINTGVISTVDSLGAIAVDPTGRFVYAGANGKILTYAINKKYPGINK